VTLSDSAFEYGKEHTVYICRLWSLQQHAYQIEVAVKYANSLQLIGQWQQGPSDINCSDGGFDGLKQCICAKHRRFRLAGVQLQAVKQEPVMGCSRACCELAHC
jgi:hypothetical protein